MKEEVPKYYNHYLKAIMLSRKKDEASKKSASFECERAISLNDNIDIRKLQLSIAANCKDYGKVKEALEYLVKFGNTESYVDLGKFYFINANPFYNPKLGIEYYRKGAEHKSAESFLTLYVCYKKGLCVEKSEDEAYKILFEAEKVLDKKDCSMIFYEIGGYYEGLEDRKNALRYFKLSAKYGNKLAYKSIAVYYLNGYGVKRDLDKFMYYLTKDINQDTSLHIASVFLMNEYAPQDTDLVELYLHDSALRGNPIAALVYALSLSTEKNPNENEITKYLDIGFRQSALNDNIKNLFDEIEMIFGPLYVKKIDELALKYWNVGKA